METRILKTVSIPYGTIKRSEPYTYNIDYYEFQFLMVRLKELINIKMVLCNLFQFLMVRLKGSCV